LYVDINLLQKKKSNSEWILIAAILFVITLSLAIFLYSQFSEKKAEEAQVESSIQTVLEQQKASLETTAVPETAEEQMKAIVEWANHQPVPTVIFLDHLTSLLPERGFLLSFSYTSNATATFRIQFDTNADAAYYLKRMKESSYLSTVTLRSIGTISTSEDTAANEETYFQPRSVADFEITINIDQLKAASSEWEAAK